jgi:hypothetical protein
MQIAEVALISWIPLSLAAAQVIRSPQRLFLVIYLGGAFLLPERMRLVLPLMPAVDKHAIAGLAAWIALPSADRWPKVQGPQPHAARLLLAALFISVVVTWLSNPDTLIYGRLILPGPGIKDAIWAGSLTMLQYLLPFYLGQKVFRTPAELRTLLVGLVIAGLLYSPLVLAESRLAPFLHQKVYGYFQHDYQQARRAGGFRAFVFMSHGLAVAHTMSQTLIALPGVANYFRRPWLVGLWISATLASCKSMGAIVLAMVAVPLALLTPARVRLRFAAALTLIVATWPTLRATGTINTEWVVAKVGEFSEDRSGSIGFRFINEDVLLEKALQRPWAGWGWWARNRVYGAEGNDTTVTDGLWVILLGEGGILKFAIVYGAMLIPIWLAGRAAARAGFAKDELELLATLAMMLVVTGIDTLPNVTSNGIPYLMAGALAGVSVRALRSRGRGALGHIPG